MRHELNIWVAGGDMRQAKLAELLADDGHTVHTLALERAGPLVGTLPELGLTGIGLADCVVLPLPLAVEGKLSAPLAGGMPPPMVTLMDSLRPGQVLCAGLVDKGMAALAAERGLTLYDYFAREELAVSNAVPVALAV